MLLTLVSLTLVICSSGPLGEEELHQVQPAIKTDHSTLIVCDLFMTPKHQLMTYDSLTDDHGYVIMDCSSLNSWSLEGTPSAVLKQASVPVCGGQCKFFTG